MSTKKQIELMEQLVDIAVLNEQFFNPSMETARIKGQANLGWTDCFERRCEEEKDKFNSSLCKEYCKRDSAQEALGKTRGLVGFCNKAKNPKGCIESVNRTSDAWNNRISRIDSRVADLKRELAKYKAQQAGR